MHAIEAEYTLQEVDEGDTILFEKGGIDRVIPQIL